MPSKDEIIGLASIAVPPSDPLEQYLLDHENDMYMNERRKIDEVFFKQGPFLNTVNARIDWETNCRC